MKLRLFFLATALLIILCPIFTTAQTLKVVEEITHKAIPNVYI